MKQIEVLNERIHLMEMFNDASIDCVMIFDTELTALYWNKMSEIVTGMCKAEVIGRHFFDLFPAFSETPEINNALSQALKGRKSFVPYEKGSYAGGYHEHHFVPLKTDSGEVIGILNIVRDVAHRIKVEKELKSLNRSLVRKNKELKNINAELLSFSRVTSHDLKEPLHKIYSFTEILLDREVDRLSDNGKMYFKRIQASAQRMRLLTDDILTYCQINSAQNTLSASNLGHVAMLAMNTMKKEIEAKEATIELGELPTIKGYHTLLLTLFQNIFNNALKFQKEGHKPNIRVTSAILRGEDIIHPDAMVDIQYARVSFTDNGIGFDQKHAEDIFQMFFRIAPSQFHGTGIGLTVCKKIAEQHHGFITADGIEEGGCTINVFLPLNR